MESSQPTSRRRKRKSTLSSDSEEGTSIAETDEGTQRRSSRIYGKQHKPEFRLPSRGKIWNDIPSVTTIPNLKRLTPKKTVNNFTKVYNKYNYDDYEDTSDDEDSSVETLDSGEEKEEKQHRIKNYHRRLQVPSSSSDEDDGKLDGSCRQKEQTTECLLKDQDKVDNVAETDATRSELIDESKFDANHTATTEAADSENSDADHALSPCKNAHLRNRSVLVSDDDSTENDDNDGDIGDSPGQNDSRSESSENDSPHESRRCTLEKQKLKQTNMFQKLRDAHAKRKRSVPKTL